MSIGGSVAVGVADIEDVAVAAGLHSDGFDVPIGGCEDRVAYFPIHVEACVEMVGAKFAASAGEVYRACYGRSEVVYRVGLFFPEGEFCGSPFGPVESPNSEERDACAEQQWEEDFLHGGRFCYFKAGCLR